MLSQPRSNIGQSTPQKQRCTHSHSCKSQSHSRVFVSTNIPWNTVGTLKEEGQCIQDTLMLEWTLWNLGGIWAPSNINRCGIPGFQGCFCQQPATCMEITVVGQKLSVRANWYVPQAEEPHRQHTLHDHQGHWTLCIDWRRPWQPWLHDLLSHCATCRCTASTTKERLVVGTSRIALRLPNRKLAHHWTRESMGNIHHVAPDGLCCSKVVWVAEAPNVVNCCNILKPMRKESIVPSRHWTWCESKWGFGSE